jgi:predicted nucleic acid-binding Zn ribbon protein
MTKKETMTNKPTINANVGLLLKELNSYESNDQGMQTNVLNSVSLINKIVNEQNFEIDTSVQTDQEVNEIIISFTDECLNMAFKKDFSSKQKECYKKAFKVVVANEISKAKNNGTQIFNKNGNDIIDKKGKVLFINGALNNQVIKAMQTDPITPMLSVNLKKAMEIANSVLKGSGFDTEGDRKSELEKTSETIENILTDKTKNDGTINFSKKKASVEVMSVIKSSNTMVDSILITHITTDDDVIRNKIEVNEMYSTLIGSKYYEELQELQKEKEKQSNKNK